MVKKLSEVANKFKVKLAQMSHDPLDPDLTIKPEDLPFPIPGPAMPKAKTPPPASKMVGPEMSMSVLPTDVKMALDKGFPQLKGGLHLTVIGNHVKVDYNVDRWSNGASALHKALTAALSPKYTVEAPVGHFNPSWTANY